MGSQWLGALLVTLVVFVGIFLLLREFWCWYWKINERIALMRETNDLLRASSKGTAAPNKVTAAPNKVTRAAVVQQIASPVVEYASAMDPEVDDLDALEQATLAAMRAPRQ